MTVYLNTENERYRYYVRHSLNGFTIHVLVVPTGDNLPLTPQVAALLQIALPQLYRLQSCDPDDADEQLAELASLNGWVAVNAQ